MIYRALLSMKQEGCERMRETNNGDLKKKEKNNYWYKKLTMGSKVLIENIENEANTKTVLPYFCINGSSIAVIIPNFVTVFS